MQYDKRPLPLPVLRLECEHDTLVIKQDDGFQRPYIECKGCSLVWIPAPNTDIDSTIYAQGFTLVPTVIDKGLQLDGDLLPL